MNSKVIRIFFDKHVGTRGFGSKHLLFILGAVFLCAVVAVFLTTSGPRAIVIKQKMGSMVGPSHNSDPTASSPQAITSTPLDTVAYNAKLLAIANIPTRIVTTIVTSTIPGTTTIARSTITKTVPDASLWPVKTAPTLMPAHCSPSTASLLTMEIFIPQRWACSANIRECPDDRVCYRVRLRNGHAADPSTPVIPALDYIAVTAQGSPAPDGKYRDRMPASQIDQHSRYGKSGERHRHIRCAGGIE